ncbi:MAG: class I SAM-dependent methyltransferase [Bacteroidetes bacterium]|nr:class I SAM-dependent methyltransferase [Bacteroidota bacterium]
MHYEPIKKSVSVFFNKSPYLKVLSYKLLDLLLLRTWHIHRELKNWSRLIPKGTPVHILDAGGGFGQYTYFLSSMDSGWNILSVDIQRDLCAAANKFFYDMGRSYVFFRTADLTEFIQPQSFNLILSVDVMEHIVDDVRVFTNFHSSLKDGGMLLLSTPSDRDPGDQPATDTPFVEEHVRSGYNIFEIKNKLKTAGFSEVETRYSYGIPGKISWRLSMKYPMVMLNFSKIFFILLPFYYLLTYPISFVLNWLDVVIKWRNGTGLIVKAWK